MFKVHPHRGRRGNVQIPQGARGRAAHRGPVHDGGTVGLGLGLHSRPAN